MLSVMQREFNGQKAFREFEIFITRDPQDVNKVSFEISGTEYPLENLSEMLNFYENVALSDRSPDGIGVCVARRNHHLPSPVNQPQGNFPPKIVEPVIVRPLGAERPHDHARGGHRSPAKISRENSPSNTPALTPVQAFGTHSPTDGGHLSPVTPTHSNRSSPAPSDRSHSTGAPGHE